VASRVWCATLVGTELEASTAWTSVPERTSPFDRSPAPLDHRAPPWTPTLTWGVIANMSSDSNLTSTKRRAALSILGRKRLGELTNRNDLMVQDRRSVDSHIEALMKARLDFAELLRLLKREELQRICDELELDRGGRECEVLIARILGTSGNEKMTWRDAILTVLRERNEPVHYSDIADEILSRKLVHSDTATPARTVYSTCINEMKSERSEIARVGRGLFSASDRVASSSEGSENESAESWIQALGVLWRRNWVRWSSNPRLLGVAPNGDKHIDFGDQRGVYVLYDSARPVYVGRVIDRPLGKRLGEHVTDRLGARWDRFSWFGLRSVTDDGDLAPTPSATCSSETFISDLEAILIEMLEPPLNRRRGDDLEAKEYRQVPDEKEQMERLREVMEKAMRQVSA
jgi:hypothetical protein